MRQHFQKKLFGSNFNGNNYQVIFHLATKASLIDIVIMPFWLAL